MLATALALAVTASCAPQLVAGVPGEDHVMFHGLSPNGRKLAIGWDRGVGPAVQRGAYVLDLRTGKRTALPHLNNAPSFSPDGRHLISANYAADRSLKTEMIELDLRNGSTRALASGRSAEWLGSYSFDGRWVLFNSTRTGTSDLYRIRRADGLIERLTDDPRYEAHAQFFDRDHKVIFHRQVTGDDYDIIIRDLRHRTERAVGSTPAEEAYPAVSPDGRWIAFSAVTESSKQPNLFIMRADGSGRRQVTDGPSKDAYATWSRDGHAIYFVRFSPGGSKIMRLAVPDRTCRS